MNPLMVMAIGLGSSGVGKISEEEWIAICVIIITFTLFLLIWAAFVMIKFYFVKDLIKRKMNWSYKNDSFWNYEQVIIKAKDCYVKAQLFLSSNKSEMLPLPTSHAKARLRNLTNKIKTAEDLRFENCYIISFRDKKGHANDEVTVYMEITNLYRKKKYKEIVVFKRLNDELRINQVIKNPTMFIITHRRSYVEKF